MRTTAQLPEKAALWRYVAAWLGVVVTNRPTLSGAESARVRAEEAITLFVLSSGLDD